MIDYFVVAVVVVVVVDIAEVSVDPRGAWDCRSRGGVLQQIPPGEQSSLGTFQTHASQSVSGAISPNPGKKWYRSILHNYSIQKYG